MCVCYVCVYAMPKTTRLYSGENLVVNVSHVIGADRRYGAFFVVPGGHRTNRPPSSCAIAVHHGPLSASLATIYIRPRSKVSHRYSPVLLPQDHGLLVILPSSALSFFNITINTMWILGIDNFVHITKSFYFILVLINNKILILWFFQKSTRKGFAEVSKKFS